MCKINVGLIKATTYRPEQVATHVDALLSAIDFKISRGEHVLLKPNLVAPSVLNDLACTHPEFVAGVALWFLDQGCKVKVGDSPASGSSINAMKIVGLDLVVQKIGLQPASFKKTKKIKLDCGIEVSICIDSLECDLFVNLPKVKSHGLVGVTLAVKNHFGIVKGWRKAMIHQLHGGGDQATFFDVICDLPNVINRGLSICDGIEAMHVTGPMGGKLYNLNLIGASESAQGLDAAIMKILGVNAEDFPIWCTYEKRGVYGNSLDDLRFPLYSPEDLQVDDFITPDELDSIRFSFGHVAKSLYSRFGVLARNSRFCLKKTQ